MIARDLKRELASAIPGDVKNWKAPKQHSPWQLVAMGVFVLLAFGFAGEQDYQDAINGLAGDREGANVAQSVGLKPIARVAHQIQLIPVAPQGCESFVAQRTTGPWEVKCYERKGK